MSEKELVDLKEMYYLRMVKAEGALAAFVRDALTVQRANKILSEASEMIKQHVEKYKD